MKKTYLLCLFLLLYSTHTVLAQNWEMVRVNDTLVYEYEIVQYNNFSSLFYMVWVDSIKTSISDTVYFMNESGHKNLGTYNYTNNCFDTLGYISHGLYRYGLPQFCGTSMAVSGVKWQFNFQQKSFVVYPSYPVGSQWVFDSVNFDTMKVVSVDTAFIEAFQVVDSIKTIAYGTNQMVISKNHGILSLQDFRFNTLNPFKLIGVQNLHFGEIVPGVMDIFDFEIGDLFVRRARVEGPGPEYSDFKVKKEVVIDKYYIDDTVVYEMANYPNLANPRIEKYWPEKFPWMNAAPNTLDVFDIPFYFTRIYYENDSSSATGILFSLVGRDRNGNIARSSYPSLGPYYETNYREYCFLNQDSLNSEDLSFMDIPLFVAEYRPGLGGVKEDYFSHEYFLDMRLIGYIKNGDTTGILNSIEKTAMENHLSVFPNPATNYINIWAEGVSDQLRFELYDVQGRLVLQAYFTGRIQLDISKISGGLYIGLVQDIKRNVLYRNRIVIE